MYSYLDLFLIPLYDCRLKLTLKKHISLFKLSFDRNF